MARSLQINAAQIMGYGPPSTTEATATYVTGIWDGSRFRPIPGSLAKYLTAPVPTGPVTRIVQNQIGQVIIDLATVGGPFTDAAHAAQATGAAIPGAIIRQETINGQTIDHVLAPDGTVLV